MTSPSDAMRKFLSKHSVSEIEAPTSVVELDASLSPLEGANVLWSHHILSAPVFDGTQYLGFFEMRDILSAVVAGSVRGPLRRLLHFFSRTKKVKEPKESGNDNDNDDNDNEDEEVKTQRFLQAMPKNKTVAYFATRNPWVCCPETATLTELYETLHQHKRCHRVPIVGADGRCTRIISQGAIVRYLAKHLKKLPELKVPLIDSGLSYQKPVVSIRDTSSAADAFRLLDRMHLTGIAVVDEDGKLVGNTSAQDIKLAALEKGHTVMDELDIMSYLSIVRRAANQKTRHPICRVTEQHTVSQVIDLLAKTGYHRVFVTNDEVVPIGVISITDLLTW